MLQRYLITKHIWLYHTFVEHCGAAIQFYCLSRASLLNLHWYACHSKVNYVCLVYVFHFFLPHTPQVISFWFTFITLIETDEWIRFVSFDFSFKNCDLQHCEICPCPHSTGRATLYDHRGWVLWCCRCYSGQNGEGGGEGTYIVRTFVTFTLKWGSTYFPVSFYIPQSPWN